MSNDTNNTTKTYSSDSILTTSDIAELLNVSERTIRDAFNKSEIKGYKRFNKWYAFYSDIVDFIKSGKQ